MNISANGIMMNEIVAFWPVCLMITLLFSFTPYLTRKSEAFGVSIPVTEHGAPALVSLRRRYRNLGLVLGAMIGIGLFLVSRTDTGHFWGSAILFLQLAAYFLLYLRFYRQAKKWKASQHWAEETTSVIAVDLSPAGQNYLSPAWLLLFPAVVAFTAVIGFSLYPSAPDRIATHYDFAGGPGGWIEKSYGVIWFTLAMQVFLSGLMSFVFYIIKKARRQIDAGNVEESARQVNLFRRAWGYYIIFTGIVTNLIFTMTLAWMLGALDAKIMLGLMLAAFVLILGGAIYLSVRIGQGGSRIRIFRKGEGLVSVRDDDRCWKLGTIYYNPDDPAVFVEKRFGIGWTCNFARPMSWVFLAALVLFIVASILISNKLLK